MIKKFLQAIGGFIVKRKIVSAIIIIVIALGGYYGYQAFFGPKMETRYILGQAATSTIMTTVSGTGQVSNSNQVVLTSKVGNTKVTFVGVQNGQQVKAGAVLVRFDATDAAKAVRDAQSNVDTAKLALAKLREPSDQLTLTQAQNAITQAQQDKLAATSNLNATYVDTFNAVTASFLDLPTIINDLYDNQFGTEIGAGQPSIGKDQTNNTALFNTTNLAYRSQIGDLETVAQNDYNTARIAYDANFTDYKNLTDSSDAATVKKLLDETVVTAKKMAQAAKSEATLLSDWSDYRSLQQGSQIFSQVTTMQTGLITDSGKINSHVADLISLQNNLVNYATAIDSADRTIIEKTLSLQQLQAGANPLDIQSQQLALQAKQNALLDAEQTYANYSIVAPFDGIVASIPVKIDDPVSSGATIATVITPQQIVSISLNEVDVSNIKLGQKATMTFDAVSDLTMTGKVVSIDTIGTVSQGVVSYNVQIAFDTQDDRIKPGMSVSAMVITSINQDVLAVPNSAIKSQGANNYVQVLANVDPAAADSAQGVLATSVPENRPVTIGVADDNNTEITSGLAAGEYVVLKTVTAVNKASTQAPSLLQSIGAGRGVGGGANFRPGN